MATQPRELDLSRCTADVATVIDVGVADGTPELYAAYPDAYLVLVEPLAEHEPDLRAILADRPGEYVLAAAGAAEGRARINVEPGESSKSSMLTRTRRTATGDVPEVRDVPVIPLDRLLDRELPTPIGVKIDTEGFELDVVRGARKLLEHCEWVIAETSVAARFKSGYRAHELLAELRAAGFVAVDFLKSSRNYVDVLFTR